MSLPVAELHLHLEGTLEPELIFTLADRNEVTLPYQDGGDLRSRYDFADLQQFLDVYYTNMQILVSEDDFADMTRAYLQRASQAGVRHAEVFLDLQAHTGRGIPARVALAGVGRTLATSELQWGVSSGLIITFLRHLPGTEALSAYDEMLAAGVPVLGVGLCSTEVGNPASKSARLFERAKADGLHRVAHAGEEGDASYVRDVLDVLDVERVDHGIRAMEDSELVDRLAAERVPLTVCPLSNVRLQAVESLAQHPLPDMLRRGLLVSVNSDDPAYFGGYVDDNLTAVQTEFGLGPATMAELADNSIESAFLPPSRKAALATEVRTWLLAQPPADR